MEARKELLCWIEKVTVRELSKLTERLLSTAIALLPVSLNCHYVQHQQSQKLLCLSSEEKKVTILMEA